jgi:hypothetical protein
MLNSVTIACLANSRKPGGRCVAGRQLLASGQLGAWVRPVSNRVGRELSLTEERYANGGEPALMDRIEVGLQAAVPHEYQVENHLIAPDVCWTKVGVIAWQDLDAVIDTFDGSLWIDGSSSYNGLNDRILHARAQALTSSLKLVEPESIVVVVGQEGINPKRAARAHFSLGGSKYAFKVTDPVAEASFFAQGEGEYSIVPVRLCISLSEPFNGVCYKLVAGIITP